MKIANPVSIIANPTAVSTPVVAGDDAISSVFGWTAAAMRPSLSTGNNDTICPPQA